MSAAPESWGHQIADRYAAVAGGRGGASTTFAAGGRLVVPGLGIGSGTFVGPESIDVFFARLQEACAGSLHVSVQEPAHLGTLTATFWVQMVARRGDASLSELQAVRVRISDDLIQEATVLLDDVRRYDAFWGGGPALLSAADGEILAKAFQINTKAAKSSGIAGLLVAMCATFLLISAYTMLAGWRLAAQVEVHAQQLDVLRGFTLTSDSSADSWRIDNSSVTTLQVTGPSDGTLVVRLPVGRDSCSDLEAQIGQRGASCANDGSLVVNPPIDVTWSTPQLLSTVTGGVPTKSVDVEQNPQGGESSVQIYSTSPVVVAFQCPMDPSTLTVTAGRLKRWTAELPGIEGQSCPPVDSSLGAASDDPPLTLRIGDGATTGSPPFTLIGKVSGQFEGETAQIDGFAGTVRILNTITANSVPTRLSMSGGELDVRATWDSSPESQSLQLAGSASSAITDAGELVPSAWDRFPMFLVPILGGLLAAFVVAPVGASASGLVATSQRGLDRLSTRLRGLLALPSQFLRRRRARTDARGSTPGTQETP